MWRYCGFIGFSLRTDEFTWLVNFETKTLHLSLLNYFFHVGFTINSTMCSYLYDRA